MNFFNKIVICKTGQYFGFIIFSATCVQAKLYLTVLVFSFFRFIEERTKEHMQRDIQRDTYRKTLRRIHEETHTKTYNIDPGNLKHSVT